MNDIILITVSNKYPVATHPDFSLTFNWLQSKFHWLHRMIIQAMN